MIFLIKKINCDMNRINDLKFNKRKTISYIFFGIFIGIVLFRLTFDVVMGDETFYLGMADRMLKGDLPFYEMYEPTQSSMFLMVPILAIYKGLVGSLDGGILFLRIIYFIISLITGILVYKFVKKKIVIEKEFKFLIFIFLFYAPFSMYCFSYNTAADLFLASFAVCLWGILYSKNEVQKMPYFCAGVIAALIALSYPTLLFFCFFMIPILGVLAFHKRKSIKDVFLHLLFYCMGGGSLALVIVTFFSAYVGPGKLIDGLKTILSDPLYMLQSQNSVFDRIFLNLSDLFSVVLIKSGLIDLLGAILIASFFRKKVRLIAGVIFLIPVYNLLYVFLGPVIESMRVIQFVAMTVCALPVVYLFINEKKNVARQIYLASLIPSLLGYLVVCSSSAGSGVQSSHVFFGTFIGTCWMYFLVIEENWKNINPKKRKIAASLIWVFPCCLLLIFGFSTYTKNSIFDMNHKISSGIYKNLKTNKETESYINFIQGNLKYIEKKDQTVLILPNGYAIYPMLKMNVYAPTTWGLYSYWYPRNEQVFVKYYEKFGKKPDRIVLLYNEKIYDLPLWEAWYPVMMKQFFEEDYLLLRIDKSKDGSVIVIYEKK